MSGILLVNFLCTDSMEMMSFFSVGDHSGLLYSRIGRAYVMKALTNKSRLEGKQRWIKLARWCALQVIFFQYVGWNLNVDPLLLWGQTRYQTQIYAQHRDNVEVYPSCNLACQQWQWSTSYQILLTAISDLKTRLISGRLQFSVQLYIISIQFTIDRR